MIVKLCGVLLILTSSFGIGYRLSKELSKRIEELLILKKIILMLRGEIKYGNSPLGEAFETIGIRMKNPYHDFLIDTAHEMGQLEGNTFHEIWKKMKDKHLKYSSLTQKDIERLMSLGENLGYLDKEMQISTIELYLEQLEQEISEAKSNLKKNGRLYQCMGIMGGILITILIL